MRVMSSVLCALVALAAVVQVRTAHAQVATPVATFAAADSDTGRTRQSPRVARVAAFSTGGVAASGLVVGMIALSIMMNCGADVGGGDEGYCGALDHPQRVWAVTSLVGAALGASWVGAHAGCTKTSVLGRALTATAIVAAPTFGTRLRNQKFWLAIAPLVSLPLHSNLQARCSFEP